MLWCSRTVRRTAGRRRRSYFVAVGRVAVHVLLLAIVLLHLLPPILVGVEGPHVPTANALLDLFVQWLVRLLLVLEVVAQSMPDAEIVSTVLKPLLVLCPRQASSGSACRATDLAPPCTRRLVRPLCD